MLGLRTSVAFLVTTALLGAPAFAQQPTPAGHVKVATGRAFIVRQNTTIPARPGDLVFAIDTLRTDADGTIGVTMMDDTRISLGPSSEVRVERYVFAPAEGGLGMVLHFVRESPPTCRAAWRSWRPTPFDSRRPPRSSASAARPWRSR